MPEHSLAYELLDAQSLAGRAYSVAIRDASMVAAPRAGEPVDLG